MSKPFVDVAVGLLLQPDGSLLLAERPSDKPWSGWWELPGGKIEAGETVLEALARELKEELNIEMTAATPWVTYIHEYPKNIVRLAFCRVTGWNGIPSGIEGQTLAWIKPHEPLSVGPLLPATEPPLRWLQLPDQYLLSSITAQENLPGFLEKLTKALQAGIKLVQFREPGWATNAPEVQVYDGFKQVLRLCREFGAKCLLNSVHPESWRHEADGVHWRAQDALELQPAQADAQGSAHASTDAANAIQPADSLARSSAHLAARSLVGVSAHTVQDLNAARALDADFVVVGHVLDTPSHPDKNHLGWEQFSLLAAQAGLPVFAIGGQSAKTLQLARQHGAHGIAGIRYLLEGDGATGTCQPPPNAAIS